MSGAIRNLYKSQIAKAQIATKATPCFQRFAAPASLGILFLICLLTSCQTRQYKQKQSKQTAHSLEDSLDKEFPLLDHLIVQKELLLKNSSPTKGKIPNAKESFVGIFNSGVIELVLDEIDGEPSYFYGHLENDSIKQQLIFIAYGYNNEYWDNLAYGKKYHLHWIETVVNLERFGDDRHRDFVVYRVEAK